MPIVLWSAALSQPIRPRGLAQLFASRSTSVVPRPATVPSSVLIGASPQCVEIVEEGLQIARLQGKARHVDVRLQPRRIDDPAGAIAAAVRQAPGAERDPARDMGQVRREFALFLEAADRMAGGAIVGEDIAAALLR